MFDLITNILLGVLIGGWGVYFLGRRHDRQMYPCTYSCPDEDCDFVARSSEPDIVLMLGDMHQRGEHHR